MEEEKDERAHPGAPGLRMSTHWKRYRQIADALTRHGLGFLVGTFGIDRVVPFHHGLLGHPRRTEPYTPYRNDSTNPTRKPEKVSHRKPGKTISSALCM